MAYVLKALESYPPNRVTFFMPQPVQALRYDEGRLVEGYLLRAAQRSDIFAHILIWHLQDEQYGPELGKDVASAKNSSFQALLSVVRPLLVDGFTPKPLICIIENFISLAKSHLFLVYFCHCFWSHECFSDFSRGC